MTLRDAMSLAMQHAFSARIAAFRELRASEGVGLARTEFLPNVTGSAQYNHFQQDYLFQLTNPVTGASSVQEFSQKGDQKQGSVDVRYDLFSTTRRLDYRTAVLSLHSQSAASELAKRQVMRDVANAYLLVIQDDALLRLADDDLARKTRSLDEARAMVKAGKRAEFEVIRAEADVATSRATEIAASNDVHVSRQQLAQVVGAELPLDFSAVPPSIPEDPRGASPAPGLTAAQLDEALKHRPDVIGSTADAQVASLGLDKARRRYLPTLSLFGDYSRSVDPVRSSFLDTNVSYGGQLVIRFDDTFANVYRAGQAKADAQAALVTAQQTEVAARLDLQKAALDVDRASQLRAANATALDAAKRNYDSVDERYRLGVASQTERVDAEATLVSAEVDAAKADVGFQTALWNLRYEMGASLEP